MLPDQFLRNHTNGSANLNTADLLQHLLRKKSWLISLVLTTGVLGFIFQWMMFTHVSSVHFIVDNPSVSFPTGKDNASFNLNEKDKNYNHVYKLVFTKDHYDYLIEKFNLYERYGVDRKEEFHYEKILNTLKTRITLLDNETGVLSIVVKDQDRYLASDMANEIMAYLILKNKNHLEESYAKKSELYNSYGQFLKNDIEQSIAKLDSSLSKYKYINESGTSSKTDLKLIAENQTMMSKFIHDLENSMNDYVNLKKFSSIAEESVRQNYFAFIRILEPATPSFQNHYVPAIFISMVVMMSTAMIFIFAVYIQLRYRHYFLIIMNGGKKANVDIKAMQELN
ncbi:MAG: hypothetical protein DWQ44_02450 [Bacteroidetes bacterium]|nr:MAG: hypothetical protein DWQ33_06180 [Bacteroidota bacterium]REK04832.1 MAG: hypothetical protein DWQ39_06345 [Bacteroidota bacterium]REK36304.1 MAG: hypothetical protein DWQ44_02450 [Bacteroidota bacterium]REK51030.1 MAG: hypothetical protein DWQ48_02770 [Bacteroidota bacterium]